MIAHLEDRAAALMVRGWTRREAEWLTLVCLHSGVFLRSQYLAFIDRTNPALAHRFVRRCRNYAVEQPWNGSRLRICRIASRRIYRVLGVEHIRHRRPAAPEVGLRLLLSLDYLLERPRTSWLPTEAEQVAALIAAGRAVEVVVVGRDLERLARAGRVLDRWASTPPESVTMAHEHAGAEMAAIKQVIATGDVTALEAYGGLNSPLQRTRILSAACAGSRRSTAAITTGRTWRSTRVPSDLYRP